MGKIIICVQKKSEKEELFSCVSTNWKILYVSQFFGTILYFYVSQKKWKNIFFVVCVKKKTGKIIIITCLNKLENYLFPICPNNLEFFMCPNFIGKYLIFYMSQ